MASVFGGPVQTLKGLGLRTGTKLPWLPENTRERGEEKLRLLLDWMCRFHYSNVALLMQLLGLNHPSNRVYFQRLIAKEFIKRVDLPTLRRPVLMLTASGLSLLEGVPETAEYNVDERRITASLARHGLAVQRAVLNRRGDWNTVIPQRLMRQRGRKVPDAMLEKDGLRTALEVELTYKTRLKIYVALADHARAIRDSRYERVEYVFTNPAMCQSYKGLFDEKRWPVYRWNERTRHYDKDEEMFLADSFAGLREAVTFTVEELPRD